MRGVKPKHGESGNNGSPEYKTWARMLRRCRNPRDKSYERYGARGISVCPEWQGLHGFQAFLAHVGRKPTPKHTLDRKDSSKPYEPGNVRLATTVEQNNNQQRNVRITVDGETRTVSEWARLKGVSNKLVHLRLKRGWSSTDAVHGRPRSR